MNARVPILVGVVVSVAALLTNIDPALGESGEGPPPQHVRQVPDIVAAASPGDRVPRQAVRDFRCDVSGTKSASPETVAMGEEVTVELTLTFNCPGARPEVDIVLAIDRSLSMRGEPLSKAVEAARTFIAGLEAPTHRVAVVSFADDVTVDAEMQHGLGRAHQALGWLVADGRTNLAGAVDAAREVLRQNGRPDANHVVILLTDGVDTVGSDPVAAAEAVRATGAELYCIGLGFVHDTMLSSMASSPQMYYHAPSPSELEGIYRSLLGPVTTPPNGDVVLLDELSPDVDLVAGSVEPPAGVTGSQLTWEIGDRPTTTLHFSYRIRPNRLGRIPVSEFARATYTDVDGARQEYTYPVPYISVIPLTPTPSPTPRTFTAYLPILQKLRCDQKDAPVDAVLVMDTSGSMVLDGGHPTKLHAARQAAHAFVSLLRLGSGDRGAVVSFSTLAQVVVPLTADGERLHSGIDRLHAGGSTAMDEGLNAGLRVIEDAGIDDPRHQVVVLLSDGMPDDEPSAMRAARRVKSTGIMLITVGFGYAADRSILEELASDGAFYYAPTGDDLRKIYEQIAYAMICR